MKKTLSLILALLMVFSLCSFACAEEELTEPVDLVFATMDVGTAIYTYSSAITNLLDGYLPEGSTIDVPTTSPGGLGAAYVVAQGKSDLIILNDVGYLESMKNGVLGEDPIPEGAVTGLVGSMDWPHVDILVRNDFIEKNDVHSIEELIEKKIPTNFVIKNAGNLGELAFVQLLEGLGITEEELESWGCTITRTAAGNIKTAMQDGTADITVDHPPDNQANTVELTMNTPCTLWDLPESVRDYMESVGWTKTTWEAGTSGFAGHDRDVATVSSSNIVVCDGDMSAELAYQITKAICENQAELAEVSSGLSEFDPENAWVTLKDYLHPGAVKYYQEMGYMP